MNCQTLDRFRGAWLGSMLGSSIELRANLGSIGLQSFILREQIARIIIESQGSDADTIADLLAKEHSGDRRLDTLAEYSYCLSLLPLIIFYGDNWSLLAKIVRKYYLKLGNLSHNSELEADILLWSYLVSSILNSGSELNNQRFSKSIGQALINVGKKTVLTALLEVVITAMERGASLQQLSEQLLSEGNSGQRAIALSYYCFATTATDFKLSVQRASRLDPKIAELTTALTGTVSGAYNGMAGIPLGWKMANKNKVYSSASQTLDLFRAWLGIYLADVPESNLEIQAIAVRGSIQTRNLKIISQKSFYS